jgi:rhodanese-related sulfurtransferase
MIIRICLKRLRAFWVFLLVFSTHAIMLQAVEYGGEKSFLLTEIPYRVCDVLPLPEKALAQGIKVISTQDAKGLFDHGALFYDARDAQAHAKAHIKGSKRVAFDESKAHYIALDLPEDKSTPLVFYCNATSCAHAYEAALALKEYGYQSVYWYSAGLIDWRESGYPVE